MASRAAGTAARAADCSCFAHFEDLDFDTALPLCFCCPILGCPLNASSQSRRVIDSATRFASDNKFSCEVKGRAAARCFAHALEAQQSINRFSASACGK